MDRHHDVENYTVDRSYRVWPKDPDGYVNAWRFGCKRQDWWADGQHPTRWFNRIEHWGHVPVWGYADGQRPPTRSKEVRIGRSSTSACPKTFNCG